MYKMEMFHSAREINARRENLRMLELNNVIFLDIDGVLQPYSNERRFAHDMEATVNYLAECFENDKVREMDRYDVAAAFYDWNYAAVGVLRELIERTHCKIVIHSGWRDFSSLEQLKVFFRIYDLDQFVIDATEAGDKASSIFKYIEQHPEIDNYVVIDDDSHLLKELGSKLCLTHDFMTYEDYLFCRSILFRNFRVDIDESKLRFCDGEESKLVFTYKNIFLDEYNIMVIYPYYAYRYDKQNFTKMAFSELTKYQADESNKCDGTIIAYGHYKDFLCKFEKYIIRSANPDYAYLPMNMKVSAKIMENQDKIKDVIDSLS